MLILKPFGLLAEISIFVEPAPETTMIKPTTEVFENDFMRLEWSDGIIIGTYKRGPITLELAKQVVQNRLNFANHQPVPIMINDIGLRSIDKDAREYLSSDDGIRGLKAGALVTDSVFGRHLANFFYTDIGY